MSQPVGPLVDRLLNRVRDPQGSAHSRAFVRTLFSNLQWFQNLATADIVATETLTIPKSRIFFRLEDDLPLAARIVSVRFAGKDLDYIPLSGLQNVSQSWFRDRGDVFRAWSTIGHNGFVVWPVVDRIETVDVTYIKKSAVFTQDSDTSDLSDETTETMLQIAEVIILARQRDIATARHLLTLLEDRIRSGL